jgi:hypothetical protein
LINNPTPIHSHGQLQLLIHKEESVKRPKTANRLHLRNHVVFVVYTKPVLAAGVGG